MISDSTTFAPWIDFHHLENAIAQGEAYGQNQFDALKAQYPVEAQQIRNDLPGQRRAPTENPGGSGGSNPPPKGGSGGGSGHKHKGGHGGSGYNAWLHELAAIGAGQSGYGGTVPNPNADTTSSTTGSGSGLGLIALLGAAGIAAWWLYKRHKKKAEEHDA